MSASGIVQLLHPAPVLHVPKGKRAAQVSMLGIRTPVRLTEIGKGETEPAFKIDASDCTLGFRRHGGHLWMRLHAVWGGKDTSGLGREALVAMLEGRPTPDSLQAQVASRALFGTPVRGWTEGGIGLLPAEMPGNPGEVLDDAREEASAKAEAFVRDRILIEGDDVLVRAYGVMAFAEKDAHRRGYSLFETDVFPALTWHASLPSLDARTDTVRTLCKFPFRPDHVEGFQRLLHGISPERVPRSYPVLAGHQGQEGRLCDEDADILLMANTLPNLLLRKIPSLAKAMPPEAAGRLRAAAAPLVPDAMRGQAGLIGHDTAEDVMERLESLGDAVREVAFHAGRSFWAADAWLRRFASARLEDRACRRPEPGDEDAMVGLRAGA